MAELLTKAERDTSLPPLDSTGWGAVAGRDAIRKILKFKNFSEAWAFMNRVALLAEKMNHHPEWQNTYNVVDVVLSTHDCHGLSRLDIDMAEKIDLFAGSAEVQKDHALPVLSLCQIRAG